MLKTTPTTFINQQRPAILMVDDQADNLAAQKATLASLDADIVTVLSGEEAILAANRRDFAVIFLDVNMPGMDGYETAEMLRLNKSTRHVPLIFVSGVNTDERSEFRGYASGAVDYLYKPVERGLLLSKAIIFLDLWNYRTNFEVANLRLEMQNEELDKFVSALRRGEIDTIKGEGTGAKVLQLLDKDIVEENARLLKELARSNQDFQDFAYAASHDMKAPLRHIKAFATKVLENEGEKLSELAREQQQYVCDGATRLSAMIDSLLGYASVDAKPIDVQSVDCNKVVKSVMQDLAGVITKTGARLELGALPSVRGEENQLYQVLLNIIDNALKYQRSGIAPVIRLNSRILAIPAVEKNRVVQGADQPTEKLAQITIEDNGIGFDDTQIDMVFAPFQRLVDSNEVEGSGIGLGTVKKIVDRHGGSITAKSTPGKGSTFIVTLPLAPLSGAALPHSPASHHPSPQRLLIVDNDFPDLDLTMDALKDSFQVFSASSAEEALTLLDRQKIDVVLTDHKMPDKNGVWLLTEVKERFPKVRRLLNSSLETADIEAHMNSGIVECFFLKPIEAGKIQARLLDSRKGPA